MIGEGGHSKVIRDIIHSRKSDRIVAILDDKYADLHKQDELFKGPIRSVHALLERDSELKCVVAIGNNEVRKSIIDEIGLSNERYINLVHESAILSPSAIIGQGTVVMANTVINADAQIGNHAIINTGAIVEHDCQIADYVHIAPKATMTGAVVIKEGAFLGAGVTVIPGTSIGEWTMIGAGSTVIHHIPAYSTAVGTPAKIIHMTYSTSNN